MGRVADRFFEWNKSTSEDVVAYRVYVSQQTVSYDSDFTEVGDVNRVNLGQLANEGFQPLVEAEGTYNLGVSALDGIGNESSIAVKSGVFLDFVPPVAPTGLVVY